MVNNVKYVIDYGISTWLVTSNFFKISKVVNKETGIICPIFPWKSGNNGFLSERMMEKNISRVQVVTGYDWSLCSKKGSGTVGFNHFSTEKLWEIRFFDVFKKTKEQCYIPKQEVPN